MAMWLYEGTTNTVSRLNVLKMYHIILLKVTNDAFKIEQKLSKVYSLMDFNFSEPIHSCFGKTKVYVCLSGGMNVIRVFLCGSYFNFTEILEFY